MEIHDKNGTKNVIADYLSRINNEKTEEFPINDYFHYDKLIAFLRVEVP